MILQNIVLTKESVKECGLYYKILEGRAKYENACLCLQGKSRVSFATYFNMFSAVKWLRYTEINNVGFCLNYKGTIQLDIKGKNGKKYHLEGNSKDKAQLSLVLERMDLPDFIEIEIVSYDKGAEIYGGYYFTEEDAVNDVNIGIGICTYRREQFVKRTIETICDLFKTDETAAVCNKLQVYVSDNAGTLDWDECASESVHVFKNRNLGGTGGFTRCMIEMLSKKEKQEQTHFILMDDDIVLEKDTIYRTFSFLSFLKEQYREYSISGGLLRLDIPYVQHANGERWQDGRIGFTKRGYNLLDAALVKENESESVPIDYSGWWYCCMPFGANLENDLPIPFFIHGDDIEYGLRKKEKFISLNGIAVWHDAFDNRKASSMEYYDMRNMLLCRILHDPEYTAAKMKKQICRHLVSQLLKYRYKDQELTMKAVHDFFAGTEFFEKTDAEVLHQQIMKMGYQMTDMTEVLHEMGVKVPAKAPEMEQLYNECTFDAKHKLTLNGWLLPACKKEKAIEMGAHPTELFRLKNVLFYEPETGKGFRVSRQFKQLLITFKRCIETAKMVDQKFDGIKSDYINHIDQITNLSFWQQYLDL